MIRRATLDDHSAVMAICNDPLVRRRMSDSATIIDPAAWLADPRNVVLWDGDNVAMFLWRWVGIYEGHVLFRTRGRAALKLGRDMLDLMFGAGAGMILAVIHEELPEAAWFVRRLGFGSRGLIETIEGTSEMFQMESARWV